MVNEIRLCMQQSVKCHTVHANQFKAVCLLTTKYLNIVTFKWNTQYPAGT